MKRPTLIIPDDFYCWQEPSSSPTKMPMIIAPLLEALRAKMSDLTRPEVQAAIMVEAAKGSTNGYVLESIDVLAEDLAEAIRLAEIAAAAEKRAARGFRQENLDSVTTDLLWFLFRNTFDAFHCSFQDWRVILNRACDDVLGSTVPGTGPTEDVRYCCLILQCSYPVRLRNWDSESDSDSDSY